MIIDQGLGNVQSKIAAISAANAPVTQCTLPAARVLVMSGQVFNTALEVWIGASSHPHGTLDSPSAPVNSDLTFASFVTTIIRGVWASGFC